MLIRIIIIISLSIIDMKYLILFLERGCDSEKIWDIQYIVIKADSEKDAKDKFFENVTNNNAIYDFLTSIVYDLKNNKLENEVNKLKIILENEDENEANNKILTEHRDDLKCIFDAYTEENNEYFAIYDHKKSACLINTLRIIRSEK
jgi:hypothetical protein